MATHSSILAWKIPWTEEPGGLLQCVQGLQCGCVCVCVCMCVCVCPKNTLCFGLPSHSVPRDRGEFPVYKACPH